MLLAGELLDERLRRAAGPAGVSATTRCVGPAAVGRVERGRDDVDAQHHPGAAAVRLVVDLAVRAAASCRGS